MFFFNNKKDKELEAVINQIRVDLSNNYKDNAVLNVKKLEELLEMKEASGSLKDKDYYTGILTSFKEDIASFKRTY